MVFSKIGIWIRGRLRLGKGREKQRTCEKSFSAPVTQTEVEWEERLEVLEARVTKVAGLLDVSEMQKRRLKVEVEELKQKIFELMRNSS